MILDTFTQQPADTLDYDIDYTDWLGTDTLSSVACTADAGITITDPASALIWGADKKVKVWASGGIDGTKYKITVTVTTAIGRIKQDEIYVRVKEF